MSRLSLQEVLNVSTPSCITYLMDQLNNSMVDSNDIDNRKDSILSKFVQAVRLGGNNLPHDTLYLLFCVRQNEISLESWRLLCVSRMFASPSQTMCIRQSSPRPF